MLTLTPDLQVSLLMIGCGAFARRYHVPAILKDTGVTIAGIFDPYPQPEVVALAARYRAPVTHRIDDLPSLAKLACALATTPHTLHPPRADEGVAPAERVVAHEE